jgi:hypothetical protein
MDYAYAALDKGIIPDVALRPVIRQLCRKRLREIDHGTSLQSEVVCKADDVQVR